MFLAFADGYLHRQETSSREFLSRLKLLMSTAANVKTLKVRAKLE